MYHYFASKEEILDMVIDYLMSLQDSQISAIISDSSSSALDKFEKLLVPAAPPPQETLEVQQHMQQNTKSLFFYLSKEEARRRSVPLVAKIVEQGVSEGVFHTDYPAQMADYIYTVAQSLSTVFFSSAKERDNKDLDAFLFLMQQTLGMSDDAVHRLRESFAKAFS
jgi:AcrR family transcriptional regulator